jgi:hypothetical protein
MGLGRLGSMEPANGTNYSAPWTGRADQRWTHEYNGAVIARGIRDYVGRDWKLARSAKDAFWAERIARLGAIEGFRIADELRRQMLRQHPGWPSADERRQDLEAHARLAQLLRRAGRAGSR